MWSIGPILASFALLGAQAAPSAGSEHIKLKDGTVVQGRATAYDAQKKVLSFRTADGKDMAYTLDQLDQRSVYHVTASIVPKDNARGQIQLANYARDIGLYAHAARSYQYAEKADPSLKPEIDQERVLGRRLAADYCIQQAQAAFAKNDVKEAERWLSLLVEKLPNEPQAEQAAAVLEQHYMAERNARDDELEREQAELLEKDLKLGKERYDRMIERTKQGLTARSSQSEALWEGAIADGEVVLKEIGKIEKKYADDPRVQEGGARYRQLTIAQMVDAHLHLASRYTVSSSYNKALKHTNAALALDPQNEQARAQRARIEQASSEGIGLNWF
ncbi:MAG: hypothetical protein EYC70_06030 [Planctomycetota bacterium]|nr:MAG: hypothetical protein EYC70_06030 [Planctomycetota bacterium]